MMMAMNDDGLCWLVMVDNQPPGVFRRPWPPFPAVAFLLLLEVLEQTRRIRQPKRFRAFFELVMIISLTMMNHH